MTASDESPPTSPSVAVVLFLGGFRLDNALNNLFDISNFDENVFWLKVGVDDTAFAMKVVEAEEYLFCDLFDQGHRNTAMVPALDETKQVLSKHLENHTYVGAVRSLVLKRVQKTDNMLATRMIRLGLNDLVEKLDLVDGGLGVVGGRSDDLEGDMFSVGVISGEPDGRKVTPS